MTKRVEVPPDVREVIESIGPGLTKWLDEIKIPPDHAGYRARAEHMVAQAVKRANEMDKEGRIALACKINGFDGPEDLAKMFGAQGVGSAIFNVGPNKLTISAQMFLIDEIVEVSVGYTVVHQRAH